MAFADKPVVTTVKKPILGTHSDFFAIFMAAIFLAAAVQAVRPCRICDLFPVFYDGAKHVRRDSYFCNARGKRAVCHFDFGADFCTAAAYVSPIAPSISNVAIWGDVPGIIIVPFRFVGFDIIRVAYSHFGDHRITNAA